MTTPFDQMQARAYFRRGLAHGLRGRPPEHYLGPDYRRGYRLGRRARERVTRITKAERGRLARIVG